MLIMRHQHTVLRHAAVAGLQPCTYTGSAQWPRSESGILAKTLQCSHTPGTACSCFQPAAGSQFVFGKTL